MKLSLLILSILFVTCRLSWAGQDERFVEFQHLGQTETCDLNTVQVTQPGRFTIVETTIDDADVMKLELKVLNALRSYCKRSDGHYPPPGDFFTLGSPDMPIKAIDVVTHSTQMAGQNKSFKSVFWYYPYERLTIHTNEDKVIQKEAVFSCSDESRKEEELYQLRRETIMNGSRTKWLFDCKRGISGFFMDEDSDALSEALTRFVTPRTQGEEVYLSICLRVTHEKPYSPE
jgi:hypothetical protein